MARVGKIVAVLTAKTAPFAKGLKQATTRLERFTANVGKVAKRVAKVGAAMFAGAAAALTAIVAKNLSAIDTLAKTADKLGIATAELQKLRLAGELTGVEIKTFDMALQRMTRRVAEAALGTGEAKGALRDLGLDAAKLAKLPLEEQFKTIADALAGVSDRGQQVRLAFKLFDSEGVALVNTLRLGRAGLEEIGAEAEKLGLTLDRVDAAKVEAANDSWTRFKSILKGVGQRITVEVAPFLTALVNKMIQWGTQGTGLAGAVSKAFEVVAKVIGFVSNMVQGLVVAWKAVGAAVNTAAAWILQAYAKISDGLEWLLDKLGLVDKGWADSMHMMADAASALAKDLREELGDAWRDLGSDPWGDRVENTFQRIREEAQKAAEEAAKIAEGAKGIEEAGGFATEEMKRLRQEAERITESVRTPLERFEEMKKLLEQLVAEELITPETFERAMKKAREELEAATKKEVKIKKEPETRESAFREVRLSRIALGGFAVGAHRPATEAVQKQIAKWLEEAVDVLRNPPPVELQWEA